MYTSILLVIFILGTFLRENFSGGASMQSQAAAIINTDDNTPQDTESDSEEGSVCSKTDTLSKTKSSQSSTQSDTDLAKERTT